MTRGVPPGKAPTRAPTHPYVLDPDVPGHCRCGLAVDHIAHTLLPTSADVTAAEQRLLGERPE